MTWDGLTEAEVYVSVALAILPTAVTSQAELRRWWAVEEQFRTRYGVTKAQEEQLTEACKALMPKLAPEPPPSIEKKEAGRGNSFGRRNTGKKGRYGGI